MKLIALSLMVLGFVIAFTPESNAARCAAGVYHAGCVGPRGAAVYRRPYAHPYAPGPTESTVFSWLSIMKFFSHGVTANSFDLTACSRISSLWWGVLSCVLY